MRDADLRPPSSGGQPPSPRLGGPKWWEPLTTKWGIFGVIIFVGLVIGFVRNSSSPPPESPRKPSIDKTLTVEQAVELRAEQILKEREAQRPAQEAAAKTREARREDQQRNSEINRRAKDLADKKEMLAKFRAAVVKRDTGKAIEIVEKDRANYLAMISPNRRPVLDREGRSIQQDPSHSAAAALERTVAQQDEAASIEAFMDAFRNPSVDNVEIVSALVTFENRRF